MHYVVAMQNDKFQYKLSQALVYNMMLYNGVQYDNSFSKPQYNDAQVEAKRGQFRIKRFVRPEAFTVLLNSEHGTSNDKLEANFINTYFGEA